jgi:hypothetical protein
MAKRDMGTRSMTNSEMQDWTTTDETDPQSMGLDASGRAWQHGVKAFSPDPVSGAHRARGKL